MALTKLETFEEVCAAMKRNSDRPFHLLLGNGFSMSYDAGIFSYNALHDFIRATGDDKLTKLFAAIDTKNFEIVMQQLKTFTALVDVFGPNPAMKRKASAATERLKQSLVDAIGELHPEHVFKVAEKKSAACARFLTTFLATKGNVFTTNYDLLLYWVLMRNQVEGAIDGFGRDRETGDEYVPPEELQYSELRWGRNSTGQRIFYVHGALPLFDTGVEVVKEVYENGSYLLENIKTRIDRGEYPIFVTAGSGQEKLVHIRHNRYLDDAYESLATIEGSLVTFGFNFGDMDEHIIEAVNRAAKQGRKQFPKLLSIYIGAYSEADRARIEKIKGAFKCKVHLFDSKTAAVWG